MDSKKDSDINSLNYCSGDVNKSGHDVSKHKDSGDNISNVFTSITNQTGASLSPRLLELPINNECLQQPSTSNCHKAAESHKKPCTINLSSSNHELKNIKNQSEGNRTSRQEFNFCENGISNESVQYPKNKVSGGNSFSLPSSSSDPRQFDNMQENNIFRESRKRPSSLKLNRPNFDDDESSSDTGNDDYSLGSEDGCIYTYRGGEHLADLPSSFFSLDMGLPLDRRLPFPPNYPVGQHQAVPNVREQGSRASSPDMDFLEMDFDPGPSCDADTSDESSPDAELDVACNLPEENEPVPPESIPIKRKPSPAPAVASTSGQNNDYQYYSLPSTSRGLDVSQSDVVEDSRNNHSYGPYITHVNMRGEQFLVRRTMCHWPLSVPVSLHISSGDLVSPRDDLSFDENQAEVQPLAYQINQGERPTIEPPNLSSALYHLNMAKKLMVDKTRLDLESLESTGMVGEPSASTSSTTGACPVEAPRCMVWSEQEACSRQVTQIGTSACGATAVVNVFIALGVPVNVEKINTAVATRQRANTAPIPRYLLSRAVAGCTAANLVTGINKASDGLVTARFFPTYPERAVSLSHWLADWIALGGDKMSRGHFLSAIVSPVVYMRSMGVVNSFDALHGILEEGWVVQPLERILVLHHVCLGVAKLARQLLLPGAVPILTLNLQVAFDGEMPDAWHHQMVFGVSSRGIYLCNPVECIRETALWPRLTSPSVLLVKTKDVLSRFTPTTDLTPLMVVPDRRFHTFNVLGQVVSVIREWRAIAWGDANGTRTRHIRLPAAYQAGITVAALTGSEAHRRLMQAGQLPILAPQTDPA